MTDLTKTSKKIVIIGGVAGGMSAAARARRLSEAAEIIVIERSGHVSYANCGLPYFVGEEIDQFDKLLVATPEELKHKLNLDIRVLSEAIAIDAQSRTITIKETKTGRTYEETYDDLILSTGASPIKPDIPGIDLPGLFAVRTVEDAQSIVGWIQQYNPVRAVIAGGGFIGLEMAEQLVQRGLEVTLIDGKQQVLAPLDPEMAAIVQHELVQKGVKLLLGNPISAFLPADSITTAGTSTPKSCWVKTSGEHQAAPADLVILGLGVKPETTLARKAGLVIGERGGIKVDEQLQTSIPGIWAVGDAIEVRHPLSEAWTLIALGGPANRQGRLAADNIFGAAQKYAGTLGTAILRVFDLTAATVGLSEKQLEQLNLPYEAVYLHPTHHAGYYPGAQRLDMKVLFRQGDGLLLGAQIVGKQGADKRIDVLSTAIKAKMSIRDLKELELAYAPPFGSAKDPINLLGMAGTNLLDGLSSQIHWHQLSARNPAQSCLIDVRTAAEREAGFIPGSIHIPLTELRARLDLIPSDKEVIAYCQSGQRSYLAYRLLEQLGYPVKTLSGGYLTWLAAGDKGAPQPHRTESPPAVAAL